MKSIFKKNIFFLAACVLVVFSSFMLCSFGGRAPQSVTGLVHLYGNVPFTFPGFETDDGHIYALAVDENNSCDITLEQLSARQGELIEVTGKIVPPEKIAKSEINKLRDGKFIVYSYKVVEFNGIKAE